MGIDVIGAGFGRTGTLSLKSALERLGFAPCYHMYELLGHLDHASSWNAANKGDVAALRAPLADYRSTVDWPGCVFWRELCDLYPEAKVVLSVRPPDKWYASFRETVGALIAWQRPDDLPEMFLPVAEMSDAVVRDRSFGGAFDLEDAGRVIAAYEAHNESVRASVAPERFLEFDVAEGWGPLCSFLGVAVPDDDFPNVNDREQFKALFGIDELDREPTEERLREMQGRFHTTGPSTTSAPRAGARRAL